MNLLETIRNTIERHGLIPQGMRVVVGVSGGADSVALARALHQLGYPIEMAHLNHQLRGSESDADEAFVRNLADELDLPVHVKSVDVESLASSSSLSLEMAARQARHELFAEYSSAVIAFAHHADDQVETFFLKLARGAGSEGLAGMAFRQQLGALQIIRPMLDIPRTVLIDWLKDREWSWREDSSNLDERFLRNRIRHSVLPLLERELNPAIRKTVLRTMNILAQENKWMDEVMGDDPLPMTDSPMAARRRKLRNWMFQNGATEAGFDTVDGILALMDKGEGSTVYTLNDHQRIIVEYGVPRFEGEKPSRFKSTWLLAIKADIGWKRDQGCRIGQLPAEAWFNAAKVADAPITVRAYEPGDRMEPLGMQGSRKLQDIFTDLKVPKSDRDRVPVVVCRNTIIWLPGYRIAQGWEVPTADSKSVQVRIEHNKHA